MSRAWMVILGDSLTQFQLVYKGKTYPFDIAEMIDALDITLFEVPGVLFTDRPDDFRLGIAEGMIAMKGQEAVDWIINSQN